MRSNVAGLKDTSYVGVTARKDPERFLETFLVVAELLAEFHAECDPDETRVVTTGSF